MVIYTGASVEEAIQTGLSELGIPRMKAHIKVIAREKKGFLGLFGKKPAQVDVEPISETTVVKADQKAVKGVPQEVNDLNEPVPTVSEQAVRVNRVVSEIKDVEAAGEVVADQVKEAILKQEEAAEQIWDKEKASLETELEAVVDRPEKVEEVSESLESDSNSAKSLDQTDSAFSELGIEVEAAYQIDEVVTKVTDYVQEIIHEMDVEAAISSSHNRRTINLQIDTNEPGRVIGYHGKVLKALQLLAQNYLYNEYNKNFYISMNVNDYVEHRAEVLQSYAQKMANRVLDTQEAQQTDPMSNNERKIIHRIISKIDGVTSYSEGDEPNRYVVVDISGD